jgi:hypothetical protein
MGSPDPKFMNLQIVGVGLSCSALPFQDAFVLFPPQPPRCRGSRDSFCASCAPAARFAPYPKSVCSETPAASTGVTGSPPMPSMQSENSPVAESPIFRIGREGLAVASASFRRCATYDCKAACNSDADRDGERMVGKSGAVASRVAPDGNREFDDKRNSRMQRGCQSSEGTGQRGYAYEAEGRCKSHSAEADGRSVRQGSHESTHMPPALFPS